MKMTPDKWEKLKVLFEAALDKPPEQRLQYLAEACAEEDLRAEVAHLLANLENAGRLPRNPALSGLDLLATKTLDWILAGRFKIIRFVARGGMGEVYEAEDQELQERVALKLVRPELIADPRALHRFKREVHLAKKVTHRNVCRTFDLFRHHDPAADSDPSRDLIFVSMELLVGETLSQYIRENGRLSTREALPLITQLAGGIEAAHHAGVVHRDFKPGNIILVPQRSTKFRAVITDFGLALKSGGDITSLNGIVGTPAYMAPEQIEGREVTSAVDIYALGLVMYEMLTGSLPFASETPFIMAVRRLHEPPPSPRSIIPDVEPVWEAAILRCLELDPAKRFSSAAEVVQTLAGTPGVASPPARTSFEGPVASASGPAEQNVEIAPHPTPGTCERLMQPPFLRSAESRTTIRPTVPSGNPGVDKGRKERWNLGPIEKHLIAFLGPIAGITVRRIAAQTKDPEELFVLLALTIPSQSDRDAFLARKDELISGLAQVRQLSASTTAQEQKSPALGATELTPVNIRHASELLARYVGPVAKVLTERAVQRADSLRTLYLILAEHLKGKTERSRFLLEAGFPEL